MEALLQVLASKDVEKEQQSSIIEAATKRCSNKEDARIFSALIHLFHDTEGNLEKLIAEKIQSNTQESASILVELIKELGDPARTTIYNSFESEIRAFREDSDRVDELLGLVYSIALEETSPLPVSFINLLWSLVASDEDSTVNLISRILNLRPYDGVNTKDWFANVEKRIMNNVLTDIPAYKCWVSWLAKGPRSRLSPHFQTTEYWSLAQRGITKSPRSTERIKYCLNILDMTLKSLKEPIDLEIMQWDPTSKVCKSLWTRYAALVEIISVDLSYNQAEDSRDDVLALCHAGQFIPPTWALALLQSGLTTQAENIRNFIVDTILKFQDYKLFNTDVRFIVDYLLPLASEASRFSVKDEEECEYMRVFGNLLSSITKDLDPEQRLALLDHILEHYRGQVYAYDFPRAITLDAILGFPVSYEDTKVLIDLANYANSARRVSKSQAIGQLIFDICLQGLKLVSSLEAIELLPRFFSSSDTYYRLDLALPYIDANEQTVEHLRSLAKTTSLYYILFDKLANKYGWDPLYLSSYAEPVQVFLYNGHQSVSNSLLDYAAKEFLSNGYFAKETYKALIQNDKVLPELQTNATGLEEALGKVQVARYPSLFNVWGDFRFQLEKAGDSEAEEAPNHLMYNINPPCQVEYFTRLASKEFSSGYMSTTQRSLNAQRIQYLLDSITPSGDLTEKEIESLEESFSHDFIDTQLSTLACIKRFLDSKYSVDLTALARAMSSMWEFLNENGLKASARNMHIEFIGVLLHARMVHTHGEYLEGVAIDIITSSHARKGLLCPLLRKFEQFGNEQLPLWVTRVLLEAYTLIRTRHDVFYLEHIFMCRYFDHSPINDKFWFENERHARVLAIKALVAQNRAEEISTMLFDEEKYHLFDPINSHDGIEENKRILCFQVLVLLHSGWSKEYFHQLLPRLVQSVDEEGSKIVRIYIEWLISSLVIKFPELLEETVLTPLINSQEPRFVSSLGRVGLLILKAMGDKISKETLASYVNVIIPLCTSNKAAIRHFSVAMIYAIYLDSQISTRLTNELRQVINGISKCAESSEQFKNFKQGDDCIWNIETDLNILGVCGGVTSKIYKYDPHYTITADEIEFIETHHEPPIDHNLAKIAEMTTIRDNVLTDNIQTKSGTDEEIKRTELIVVASLCDIPVNLGGICRLSDALGVKMLTLNDLGVTKNSQFKSTCVTADLWQPMKQVKEDAITEYLLEQKRNGYTLIGLEQTDNSRILRPDLKFPEKSLLLIGRERQGIPGNLLAHLDFCVEIEQWGVVRSMNVQTATAVIVHAYNNQH